jgi:hypothetical protein
MQPIASIVSLRRVVGYGERNGVDPRRLMEVAGVDRETLATPSALVPLDHLLDAYLLVHECLGDDCVGLSIASTSTIQDYGILGYLLTHHVNLHDGIHDVARLYRSLVFGYGFDVQLTDDDLVVEFLHDSDGPGYGLFAQDIMGALVYRIREAMGYDVVPSDLELVPHPGADLERGARCFEQHLGCRPRLDTGRWAVAFRVDDALRPFPKADPALLAHLHDACVTMIARRRAASGDADDVLRLSDGVVDLLAGQVHRGDLHVHLTTKEVQILRFFASNRNRVVPHDVLEREVWGLRPHVLSHAPAVAIRRLRQKIEVDPSDPKNLVTVFGEGWKLNLV